MTWNVENLFLLPERVDHSVENSTLFAPDMHNWLKPIPKVRELAGTIRRTEPDIVFLQEVGGAHSLESFCENYLAGEYVPLHLQGNSERGIEVSYLIKKDTKLKYQLISHANYKLDLSHIEHPNIRYRKLFERNVLQLHLELGPFNLSLFGVHLKSGYDPTGKDPGGRLKRLAEVRGLVEIVNHYLDKGMGEYLLLGDFNAPAAPEVHDLEIAPIYTLPHIRELLHTLGVARADRATFLHTVQREMQLDYIFFSKKCFEALDSQASGIVYPRDIGGGPFRWPTSTAFKQGLPSDHLPLLFCLDLDKLQTC